MLMQAPVSTKMQQAVPQHMQQPLPQQMQQQVLKRMQQQVPQDRGAATTNAVTQLTADAAISASATAPHTNAEPEHKLQKLSPLSIASCQ